VREPPDQFKRNTQATHAKQSKAKQNLKKKTAQNFPTAIKGAQLSYRDLTGCISNKHSFDAVGNSRRHGFVASHVDKGNYLCDDV
jgi:hypothetical protein